MADQNEPYLVPTQVVLVSSMGGLDKHNFLNRLGKDKYGEGHGDILIWKRKAERYLCLSGLQYTILHPGGLIDPPRAEQNGTGFGCGR